MCRTLPSKIGIGLKSTTMYLNFDRKPTHFVEALPNCWHSTRCPSRRDRIFSLAHPSGRVWWAFLDRWTVCTRSDSYSNAPPVASECTSMSPRRDPIERLFLWVPFVSFAWFLRVQWAYFGNIVFRVVHKIGSVVLALTYFELRPVMVAVDFRLSPSHSIHLNTNDLNECAHHSMRPIRATDRPDRTYSLWLWRKPCARSATLTTLLVRILAWKCVFVRCHLYRNHWSNEWNRLFEWTNKIVKWSEELTHLHPIESLYRPKYATPVRPWFFHCNRCPANRIPQFHCNCSYCQFYMYAVSVQRLPSFPCHRQSHLFH